MKIRYPYVFGPLLLSMTMGSTECDDFDTVTVPASDTSPPLTVDGVWNGNYKIQKVSTQPDGIVYHMGAEEMVMAVSAAVDSDGVSYLTQYWDETWKCCSANNTACETLFLTNTPPGTSDYQSGGVGSQVSSGIWVGVTAKKKRTVIDCPGSKAVTYWRFRWWTKGENFHGGKVTGKTHQLVWP